MASGVCVFGAAGFRFEISFDSWFDSCRHLAISTAMTFVARWLFVMIVDTIAVNVIQHLTPFHFARRRRVDHFVENARHASHDADVAVSS